jgi:hypothetical protein
MTGEVSVWLTFSLKKLVLYKKEKNIFSLSLKAAVSTRRSFLLIHPQ